MKKSILTVFMCVLVLAVAQAWGMPIIGVDISCEGTESGGGGARNYQYTLRNISGTPITLTEFYVGTQDLNAANYSNWLAPAGFSVVVYTPGGPPGSHCSTMYTTTVKTPHGVIPPQGLVPSLGLIAWGNPTGITLPAGGTATFGFDNPNPSWDVEWLASDSTQPCPSPGSPAPVRTWVSIGLSTLPIAGPTGVYTGGWVHSPIPEPATFLLLGLGGILLHKRKR